MSVPMRDRMRRIHTIHFVGIGGSGMGGIAEVLLNLGYQVQGSDLKANDVTRRLAQLGVFERGDQALRDVQVRQDVAALGGIGRQRVAGRAGLLGVPQPRVVVAAQPVDVVAARADRQVEPLGAVDGSRGQLKREAGAFARPSPSADQVARLGRDRVPQDVGLLVPV